MCTATIAERPLALCTGFDAFPMTPSGKSQKFKLRESFAHR